MVEQTEHHHQVELVMGNIVKWCVLLTEHYCYFKLKASK